MIIIKLLFFIDRQYLVFESNNIINLYSAEGECNFLLPSVFCVLNIEVSDEKNDAGTGTPEKGCLNR
jgi:hypothetical protein